MTTTEPPQNSSANTSPDEPEGEKSFEGIPYDHFENEPSGITAPLSEESQKEFDAEIERLKQFKG